MVSVSTLRVPSSHFAEKEFFSQQQPYFDIISPKSLEDLLFDYCPGCQTEKMSSIPQGAYATWKVRINEGKNQVPYINNMVSTEMKESERPSQQQSFYRNGYKKYLEQPPAKYNSKLMNSIWGLYNRYSVHNLKKVTEGEEAFAGVQKSSYSQNRSHTL